MLNHKNYTLSSFCRDREKETYKKSPEISLPRHHVVYKTQHAFREARSRSINLQTLKRVNLARVLSSKEIITKVCAETTNSLQHFIS